MICTKCLWEYHEHPETNELNTASVALTVASGEAMCVRHYTTSRFWKRERVELLREKLEQIANGN